MVICSHCVAVAHFNGELSEFVAAKGKRKKTPNVSRLLATGMPRGRGHKGVVNKAISRDLKANRNECWACGTNGCRFFCGGR